MSIPATCYNDGKIYESVVDTKYKCRGCAAQRDLALCKGMAPCYDEDTNTYAIWKEQQKSNCIVPCESEPCSGASENQTEWFPPVCKRPLKLN